MAETITDAEQATVNISINVGTVMEDVLRNMTGIFTLDAEMVDYPRIKLAIWIIRIAFWIGGFGEPVFEYSQRDIE